VSILAGREKIHAPRKRRRSARGLVVIVHRYCGLATAVFLAIAGITGSVLAYNSELEKLLSPQLFANPQPGPPLDFATLADRAAVLVPEGRVTAVEWTESDRMLVGFVPRIDRVTGRAFRLGFTQFFIDPWTGKETGRRIRGDLSQGIVNLMPFLYSVHWTLGAGNTGQWIMGLVAVIWTIDCFIAFYLTLPRGRGNFMLRWKYAWQVKWCASAFRVNFDLHRASGLWTWPFLIIFAWSSVMMNIRPWYEHVMAALFDYQRPMVVYLTNAQPNERPRLDWHAAIEVGQKLMAEQAHLHGFIAGEPLELAYSSATGAYSYEVRGSHDVFERAPKGGSTRVTFDGNTGELRVLSQPTGERIGNTIESWLYALHMARVFGRAYQAFVCVLGLICGLLPISGVYIWWRKRGVRERQARQMMKRRAQAVPAILGEPSEGLPLR